MPQQIRMRAADLIIMPDVYTRSQTYHKEYAQKSRDKADSRRDVMTPQPLVRRRVCLVRDKLPQSQTIIAKYLKMVSSKGKPTDPKLREKVKDGKSPERDARVTRLMRDIQR